MTPNQPIVIDNGSGLLKAGFAGDEMPKCCFSNCIASLKHPNIAAITSGDGYLVGPTPAENRHLENVRYPMEHGIVTDWGEMEAVWEHVYSRKQLNVKPENHPVLLTEASLIPKFHRERMAEVFFEGFRVPELFVSSQAVLSLYSSKRTTGVVLDCGDGVTQAVPVYEGYASPHGVVQVKLAGRDITHHLQLLLRKEGYRFYTSSDFEVIRTIKEKACYVVSRATGENKMPTVEKKRFVLPEHTTVLEMGRSRYLAPEILFRPEFTGKESMGIHEVLSSAIQKSDLDLRPTFYRNIILSGGSTLFPGFVRRFVSELENVVPRGLEIEVHAPQDRLFSTWIGGSVLASLKAFRKMWVSKLEYDEIGPASLHKNF